MTLHVLSKGTDIFEATIITLILTHKIQHSAGEAVSELIPNLMAVNFHPWLCLTPSGGRQFLKTLQSIVWEPGRPAAFDLRRWWGIWASRPPAKRKATDILFRHRRGRRGPGSVDWALSTLQDVDWEAGVAGGGCPHLPGYYCTKSCSRLTSLECT